MAKLNVFIDGTWLFRSCSPSKVLASKTERPENSFSLNFAKFDQALLQHVNSHGGNCDGFRDRYIATSIFDIPDDFESWSDYYEDFTPAQIEQAKRGSYARDRFVNNAIDAGYSSDAIFRPRMKHYILKNLTEGKYQEKQVDATVVALLVRSAIEHQQGFHAIVTGDSDILPAIRVAYPEYTKNVVIVSTHPDELSAEHRQTSFSLNNFDFDIPPFYLQDHVVTIIHGENPYRCAECNKVFVRSNPIPQKSRPYCNGCYSSRT